MTKSIGGIEAALAAVASIVRQRGGDKVLAMFNLSAEARPIAFVDGPFAGRYRDFSTGAAVTVDTATRVTLPPWSSRLLAVAP